MELHKRHLPGWEGVRPKSGSLQEGEKPCDQVREVREARDLRGPCGGATKWR